MGEEGLEGCYLIEIPTLRRNSAQVIPVATATFNDSEVTLSIGKFGIKSFLLINFLVALPIPLPSLPMTMNPWLESAAE